MTLLQLVCRILYDTYNNTVATRSVIVNSDKNFLANKFHVGKQFWTTGSVLDNRRTHRRHKLTDEKQDEIHAKLNTSLRKIVAQFGVGGCICIITKCNKTFFFCHKLCNAGLRQHCVLLPATIRGCMLEKWTPHSFSIMVQLFFIALSMWIVSITYCSACIPMLVECHYMMRTLWHWIKCP